MIRVAVELLEPGIWGATIRAPGRHITVYEREAADALEGAVRVWRIANALRRERRKKMN